MDVWPPYNMWVKTWNIHMYMWLFSRWFNSRVRPRKNFHFYFFLCIVMRTSENRENHEFPHLVQNRERTVRENYGAYSICAWWNNAFPAKRCIHVFASFCLVHKVKSEDCLILKDMQSVFKVYTFLVINHSWKFIDKIQWHFCLP